MAAKAASVSNVPLKHLHRHLDRYNKTVLRKSYTALTEVSKDAVQTVKAAVIAAPPTKNPRGPSRTPRKRKFGYLEDIPMRPTGAVTKRKYDAGVRLDRSRQGEKLGLVNNGAVATGKYLAAWRAKRMRQGSRMGILIYNMTVQGPRVEYGRKPGKMPPVQAIRKWLQAKFSLPYRRARRLAWPIAKAIKRDGIPARAVLFSDKTNMMLGFYMEEAITKAQLAAAKEVFK